MESRKMKIRGIVVIEYSHKNKFFRKSTGVAVRDQYKSDNLFVIGAVKQKMDKIIKDYFLENGVLPSPSYVKSEFNKPKVVVQTKNLMEQFEAFYLLKCEEDIKQGSLKGYQNLRTALYDYQKKKKVTLTFDDINEQFFMSFQKFLSQPVKKSKKGITLKGELNSNTIKKRMVIFKVFLRYIQKIGAYHFKDDILRYQFKIGYRTPMVTLDREEVNLIYNLELKGMQERVRDLFVFMCCTGMRISDLRDLTKEQIRVYKKSNIEEPSEVEKEYYESWTKLIRLLEKKAKVPKQEILPFRYIQDNTFVIVKDAVKTMNEIKIPLNDKALQILAKYDFRLPKYEGQVINRVLKEILMNVPEFQQLERHKVETYGRVITDTSVPKYQLITNHTARRTFITLCVDANIDIKTIMKMTGHKKLETLNIYIDKAKKIEDKWISLMNF